jgi:2',3'-cyclic-nucleotide 2'-phosphodiesterase (5'-nucleotidase family)
MHYSPVTTVLTTIIATAFACEPCEHPERDIVLTRNVRRMQPEAVGAVSEPRAPLEWGQLNFMHTSDTHGWLVRVQPPIVLVLQYTDTNCRKVT